VAAKRSAHEKLAALKRLFRELANLAAETEAIIHQDPEDPGTVTQIESLIRRAALAKHELSLPDGHVVRRFFEASRLDEVLATLRDMSAAALERRQAAADHRQLEEQRGLAEKMDANLHRVAMIQSVIHFIEYLLVVTYSVELWEAFFGSKGAHAEPGHFHWILLVPAGLGLALVMIINYTVEGHWVEWQWIKSLFGRKKPPDKEH
jgi:hypothetical protein